MQISIGPVTIMTALVLRVLNVSRTSLGSSAPVGLHWFFSGVTGIFYKYTHIEMQSEELLLVT